jgi:hypothetical protein
MKKSILLLSGLGIGAGVLYAIGARRDTKSNGKEKDSESTNALGDDTDRSATDSPPNGKLSLVDSDQKSSMGRSENGGADVEIDDQGTVQSEASEILKHIRDSAFDSSNENLALALGRPTEEIENEIGGISAVDGDELMKVRKLAMERGVEL